MTEPEVRAAFLARVALRHKLELEKPVIQQQHKWYATQPWGCPDCVIAQAVADLYETQTSNHP